MTEGSDRHCDSIDRALDDLERRLVDLVNARHDAELVAEDRFHHLERRMAALERIHEWLQGDGGPEHEHRNGWTCPHACQHTSRRVCELETELAEVKLELLHRPTHAAMAQSWAGHSRSTDRAIADGKQIATLERSLATMQSERDAALDRVDQSLALVTVLTAERDDLRNALRGAVMWMDDDGCDCGTDEPGTCALCVAEATLREINNG